MSYKADPKLIGSFDPDFYNEATETFKSYDKNGDGVIQKNEFISLLKKLNLVYFDKIENLFKYLLILPNHKNSPARDFNGSMELILNQENIS